MLNPFRSHSPAADVVNPLLIVHSRQPYNAEPPPAQLRESFVTQMVGFYVRSHGNIPAIDPAIHRLRIMGRVATELDLSMNDLRARFPTRTVMATLQCAGNRRADMRRVRPVSGDPWGPGAVGTAEWRGASLSDVLRAAGAGTEPGFHVAFASADECHVDGQVFHYGASIPMAKALGPEVLLAYEMNGGALSAEHGAPLRLVVPGYAGVRSPKWLHTVTVQDAPSDNPMQAGDYKLYPPHVRKKPRTPREASPSTACR